MLKYFLLLVLIPLGLILTGCQKKVAPPPNPYAPSNLTATAISSEEIELVWDDNSVDEKGFYVYRKDNGDYRRIVALGANVTSYHNSNLDPQTTYWYLVSSYNNSGESGLSNETSATTMVEVEILDFRMEKEYRDEGWTEAHWLTRIIGHVRNNTTEELSRINLAGNFYDRNDAWIAIEHSGVANANSGKTTPFQITHVGKTEIIRVTVWIEDYY